MYDYKAKFIRVVDGCAVDLNVSLGFFSSLVLRFHLAGVVAPETGQSGCKEATGFVAARLSSAKSIVIRSTRTDGAWLAEIFYISDDASPDALPYSLNKELVAQGHAVPYME